MTNGKLELRQDDCLNAATTAIEQLEKQVSRNWTSKASGMSLMATCQIQPNAVTAPSPSNSMRESMKVQGLKMVRMQLLGKRLYKESRMIWPDSTLGQLEHCRKSDDEIQS
jgi:hypothetical protein